MPPRLAFTALRRGISQTLASVTFVWGLVVVLFGLTQRSIAPEDGHAIVQVAHLAVERTHDDIQFTAPLTAKRFTRMRSTKSSADRFASSALKPTTIAPRSPVAANSRSLAASDVR